ncbi:MAG TPA: hypothetical protein VFV41_12305 [Streptosporangiaceae bacterium]|nr:hypothetical protein [Streptosporangiaceae bacterium]
MSDDSLEASEADAAEQEATSLPGDDETDSEQAGVPLEADPADAAEQAREVPDNEDEDYR